MDFLEFIRTLKRNCDNLVSKKRLVFVVIFGLVTFMYIVPFIVDWLGLRQTVVEEDRVDTCLRDRLTSFYSEKDEFNLNIVHLPSESDQAPFISYVGNGFFGLDVVNADQVYLRSGRFLSLASSIYPVFNFKNVIGQYRTAYVTNYLTGIVHVFRCFDSGVYASFQYYAHRRLPTLLVQEIKISNPTDRNVEITFEQVQPVRVHAGISRSVDVKDGAGNDHTSYNVTSGYVSYKSGNELVIPITVVSKRFPFTVKVDSRSSKLVIYYTAISYSNPVKKTVYQEQRGLLEKNAIGDLQKAASNQFQTKESHAQSWQRLWSTGFSIGTSKAKDVLNGDQINATMYYVLSQVKDESDSTELMSHLSYAEGCYGNHHTLEATSLWEKLDTIEKVNRVVSLWLLTLEKNGCHNMLKAGALGLVQAMVLSFGGLRFSNQHLEFNIHPKYLHRDFLFRRIAYGNLTHVNISVALQEDNRAMIRVALDRSDKNYYACDGGCLDVPVQLGPIPAMFPVKLTSPLTAILYVTYDKQHMEELRNTIHVREIAEAPAHEHHVIALHKHGHHLGGLPTFFWVSVSILILIFHLFLFKLIYNEYCSGGSFDRHRFRYGKL